MCTTGEESRIKQVFHIACLYRPISDTARGRFNLNQRLEIQRPARPVALDHNIKTTRFGDQVNANGNLVCPGRNRRTVLRNPNDGAHCPASATNFSSFASVTRPASLPLMVAAGAIAQFPRQ